MDNENTRQTLCSFILQNESFQEQSFRKRYSEIAKIQSHHVFPIKHITSSIDTHSVNIKYKYHPFVTLADYSKNIELLPSQIKSIIWQVTKLMVECEQLKINHLHLSTKSIVIAKSKYFDTNGQSLSGNPFIWVRDFSFGKQFKTVSEGKKLQIFEFLHPKLSIGNSAINLDSKFYQPEYDIWSFGLVIYYLIYKKSPFRKQGREIFSKTILREFLRQDNSYQISFPNRKYASINQFISKCLRSQFKEWRQIKRWIVDEEQIYNQTDFQLTPFHFICQHHLLVTYLFSSIYQMIIQQSQKSVHPFWQMKIENHEVPFVFQTLDYILVLISNIHKRFLFLYHSHYVLLENNSRFQIIYQLDTITKSISNQVKNVDKKWLIPKAHGKQEVPFTLELAKQLQLNFAVLKIKSGINRRNMRDSGPTQSLVILRSVFQTTEYRRMGGWKSLEILFDFCDEMISIFNETRNRMKLVFELVYTSKLLADLAVIDFKYPLQ